MNNQNIISNKFDLFWTTLFSYTSLVPNSSKSFENIFGKMLLVKKSWNHKQKTIKHFYPINNFAYKARAFGEIKMHYSLIFVAKAWILSCSTLLGSRHTLKDWGRALMLYKMKYSSLVHKSNEIHLKKDL